MSLTTLSAQTVAEIVSKHINALGGEDKLSKLKSAQIVATVAVATFEVKGTTTVLQNKGIRIEQEIQGMKMIQAFDGNTAWAVNPMLDGGKAVKLPAEQSANLKEQMDLTGLYNYKEKGYKVEFKGEDIHQGEPVYVISVTMPDGNAATNFLSKNTYLTLKTTIKILGEDGNEVESNIYTSDYKVVDGIVTPHSIEIDGTGTPGVIKTHITSVRYNIDIDPSIFTFPGN